MVFFHGGPRGMVRGQFLLPPDLTRVPSCSEYGAAKVHRRDRVYLTTERMAAVLFAASHKRPAVYVCEPIGPLEDDPDYEHPGVSFQCARARIIKVTKPSDEEIALARSVMLNDPRMQMPLANG